MQSKRVILIVLFLLLLIAAARTATTPLQAATPAIALNAPASILSTVSNIDVSVVISNSASLGAFEFDLLYDSTLVQVTGFTLNTFIGVTGSCNPASQRCVVPLGPQTQTSGMTSLGAYTYGAGAGPGGSGTLATIHLKPLGHAGTLTLQFAKPLVSDSSGNQSIPLAQGTAISLSAAKYLYLPLIRR